MTIGQRIARMRKERGLSQEALGEQLGVSRQSVYKWESDAALPEIDKLIAMSRLFEVTVGWLLGVEEAATPRESAQTAETDSAEREDGELTEAQLRMVQEIVDRYIASQPKPKKRRWLRLAGVCAAAALLWTLADLGGELNALSSRYYQLQNSVSNVSSSVNNPVSGIADRVEEVLQSQNSLLVEEQVELTGADLSGKKLFLSAKVTPRTYTGGMQAVFLVDTGDGPVEYPAGEMESHQFAAEIICPLTDTTTVSVALLHGDTRETQLLGTWFGLYGGTFPSVLLQEHVLMGMKPREDGALHFTGYDYAYYIKSHMVIGADDALPVPEIRQVQVGLFKNRELVTWLTLCEGIPENYRGIEGDAQFYQVPACDVPVEEGDLLAVAALVTDELGRQQLYPEMAYALDEDGQMFWADELIKDDWYDSTGWNW